MFLRIYALISVVLKRIFAQPWLTLAALLGLVLSAALAISIPLYADATYHRIFKQNLDEDGQANTSNRPPMVLLFHFPTGNSDPAEWDELEALDSYLTGGTPANTLGLRRTEHIRYLRTAELPLFPQGETAFNVENRLLSVRLGFMSGLDKHVTVTEGAFPSPASDDADAPIEVLISEPVAQVVGFQIGEIYTFYAEDEDGEGHAIPIRIAGIWLPANPAEEYWFTPLSTVQESFFITEEDYQNKLAPIIENDVSLAFWYSIFDDSSITYEDAQPLISSINRIERRTTAIKEGVRLSASPVDVMERYQRDARLLTLTLQVMSIPIVGLLLTFISLVARLIIEGRRNEIAVLRSRGASRAQIISLSIIEALILGAVGLAISLPLGIGIASIMGKTESFLSFALDMDTLRAQITRSAVLFGVAAVVISALAQLWPTMGASGFTILTYKRTRARLQSNPWWQRAWLDVILLLASAYGYSLLQREGGIISAEAESPASQFQDPLLYLLPVLVILSLTMFFLRLMPILLNGAAWLLSRTRSVSLLMAVRHVARTPSAYSIPLTLLILTLSLSIFTASMADSLDRHLVDQTYYQYGADVVFSERGENTSAISAFAPAPQTTDAPEGPQWVFLPVSDYLEQPDVEAVTRVGSYSSVASVGSDRTVGTFYGIDRMSFAQAAYWRSDFAPTSLGDLMNRLAQYPDGLLVSNTFLSEHGLRIGDLVTLDINAYGDGHDLDYRVAGTFDLFPGWYPEEQALFVGNLEYFFEQAGSQYPYHVWVRAKAGAEPASLAEALAPQSIGRDVPQDQITESQASPRRQGMFGILSVGYSSAVILTVIGFLMYALFSFRQRTVELGMMRAIGLSTVQMGSLLAWELALLIVMGSIMGTALGIGISNLFVPFMKVSGADILNIPPYQVHIAWFAILRIYAIFGLLFAIELTILVMLLRRMKISQAIKLGETI